MKKLLSIFLTLIICFSIVSCDNSNKPLNDESIISSESIVSEESTVSEESIVSEESDDVSKDVSEDDKPSTPLLFKVSDKDGNYAWLFGSIHIGDEKLYPLPSYVKYAFEESDALAVEFDVVSFQKDMNAVIDAMASMVYKDGTKISNHISKETYDAAVDILKENNSYKKEIDLYMPCYWQLLINNLMYAKNNIDTENGVDINLIKEAYKQNKPVYDIESPELQYGMMASLSDETQEMLLKSAIASYKANNVQGFNILINAWAGGHKEILRMAFSTTPIFQSEKEKELYEEYTKALITDRDSGMVEYTERALTSGETLFICVGSAHVIGTNGMVDQLEDKGYTVEQYIKMV